jgi:quinolinate synthase
MAAAKPIQIRFERVTGDIGLAPAKPPEVIDAAAKPALVERAKRLLAERDAVLVAHYYVHPDLQDLAQASGGTVSDSLEMARFGHEHRAKTIVVAGVRFMGETAKILNPEKRVLMPDLLAECSLDLATPADEFSAFCDAHPDRTVVVYANTERRGEGARRLDGDLVDRREDRGAPAPPGEEDPLGARQAPGRLRPARDRGRHADVERLLRGARRVQGAATGGAQAQAPEGQGARAPRIPARRDPPRRRRGLDHGIIQAAERLGAKEYIVATDGGIIHQMKKRLPGVTFIEAPTAGKGATCQSCAHCPWMAMNGLGNLLQTLEGRPGHEVFVDPAIGKRAKLPIERMLEFAKKNLPTMQGSGDA